MTKRLNCVAKFFHFSCELFVCIGFINFINWENANLDIFSVANFVCDFDVSLILLISNYRPSIDCISRDSQRES